MHPRFTALLALLAVSPASLHGQGQPDRLALDNFRDSLALVHDTATLRTLQKSLASRSTADPMIALRSGLVALRRAELGADADAGDARGTLRRVARTHPEWPYAWHALARAEIRRAEWERADSLALGNRIGSGTLARAIEHERRAIEADPGFSPAALTLADLALGLRDTSLYPAARDAVRRSGAPGAKPSPALLLALGRLERASGDRDSALAAFTRAVALSHVTDAAAAPDTAGTSIAALAQLELARTGLGFGDARAEPAYYAGAVSDAPSAVAGYRADLVPIATDAELAEFDATRGEARTAFLRRFWTDRDRAELRQDGERLREHYRRLLYARRHFTLTVSRRFYNLRDAYRSGSEELDDRGVIYVRHGEPATRLRPFVFGLMPSETWRYGRADGDLMFHFSAGYDDAGGGDLYDYRLVESVHDLHGAADAPVDQLLLSRATLTPIYGRMLNWGPHGAARARAQERGIGRASIEVGTTTDSYELQFVEPLAAYADLVAVGAENGLPLAHLVFAVGGPELTPVQAPEGLTYPLRVRLVALDAREHAVAHLDTTVTFRLRRPVDRHEYLIGRVDLPLPAGRWSWRAALAHGGTGAVLPRDTVLVVGAGPSLSVSDLALGLREASAIWQPAAGDTVYLTPFNLFRQRSEPTLYYEVSGAASGGLYRHQIAIFRMKGDPPEPERRPVVTLGFEEKADQSLIRAHRVLQLQRLRPGIYLLEVRVRGPDGVEGARRRVFRVGKER